MSLRITSLTTTSASIKIISQARGLTAVALKANLAITRFI